MIFDDFLKGPVRIIEVYDHLVASSEPRWHGWHQAKHHHLPTHPVLEIVMFGVTLI